MEQTSQKTLKIVKKKLVWDNPVDGYHYTLKFPNGTVGDAQLIYCQLSDWRYEASGRDFYNALLVEGLKKDAIIAHLNEFYPNGRGLSEKTAEKMRAGRGTQALNFLIKEAKEKDAAALYVFSGKGSMQSFLEKHLFTKCNKWRYYKIFQE